MFYIPVIFQEKAHASSPELSLHEVKNSTLSHGEKEWEKP
jgi:hypothetical protein